MLWSKVVEAVQASAHLVVAASAVQEGELRREKKHEEQDQQLETSRVLRVRMDGFALVVP